ncbi:hypothetical protein BJ508DRAFT_153828 [Ascobolus immersus RN42]|uniref:Uncharacterized protein n=1 Tax=Ascobolus immersus RN42 TaxID=1160509 RepID=A0A3N4HXY1_ASCIM|nr:hypothetical protein BJ508DRAFT_153828 [Ascobolus immersus RN42]
MTDPYRQPSKIQEDIPFRHLTATEAALPASILSAAVHRDVLAHFAGLEQINPEWTGTVSECGIPNNYEHDGFYALYCSLLLRSPTNYSYPPPFYDIINEFATFYITDLYPYFYLLGIPKLDLSLNDPRAACVNIIFQLGSCAVLKLPARWSAGLMREDQIILLKEVIRRLLAQIRGLLELEPSNERLRYIEIDRLSYRAYASIITFFGSGDFRSGRLESLIVGYLAEEGVNTMVVRGVEAATRERESLSTNPEPFMPELSSCNVGYIGRIRPRSVPQPKGKCGS